MRLDEFLVNTKEGERDLRPKLFDKLCYFVETESVDHI